MRKFLYILSLSVCMGHVSCSDDPMNPDAIDPDKATFMSLSLRAQSGHSINADVADHEDRVNTLAMLVFPTGEIQRDAYYFGDGIDETAAVPATQVKAGKNDIYFIANIDKATADGLTLRSQAEDLLRRQQVFAAPLNNGATALVGFPMARVYYAQPIPGGYSQANPFEWKPSVTPGKPLLPVSAYGEDLLPGTQQEKVGLVRSCAKVSLIMTGEGAKDIQRVSFFNAASAYTLAQLPEGKFPALAPAPLHFTLTAESNGSRTATLYIPERLFNGAADVPGWDNISDTALHGAHYIEIMTKAGKLFRIPVVSNGPASGYLDFAKGVDAGASPDYNIIRNNAYRFTIAIPQDAKEIEVAVKVLPWTLVESEISYDEPVYTSSLSFPDGNGSGEFADEKTVRLHQQKRAKISFKLSSPAGALWRATLTNGLDFSLTPAPSTNGETGATVGITDPNALYTFYITPLKPYQGTPRFTELYMLVNGQEIQIVPQYMDDDTPSGPGKRFVFKQVE